LSTRAHITPTSFVNSYQWGSFRGDPRRLVERYFDAFLYLANWGTRELMVRLPVRLVDPETVQRYCAGDAASAWRAGDHVVVAAVSEDEEAISSGAGRASSRRSCRCVPSCSRVICACCICCGC
jgi:hypothetical protein